jgi:hypothetical protein
MFAEQHAANTQSIVELIFDSDNAWDKVTSNRPQLSIFVDDPPRQPQHSTNFAQKLRRRQNI